MEKFSSDIVIFDYADIILICIPMDPARAPGTPSTFLINKTTDTWSQVGPSTTAAAKLIVQLIVQV